MDWTLALIGFGEAGFTFASSANWAGQARGWDILPQRRAAMAAAKVAALPGSLTRPGRTPTGASTRASSQMVRLAAAIAAAAKIAGKNHSDTAIRWRKSVRHSGSGRTGSALMDPESPSPALAAGISRMSRIGP